MPQSRSKSRKNELDQELNRIMPIFVKKYRPEKVILFGSMGSDRVKEWSDIDLAIIKRTKKTLPERWDDLAKLLHPQRAMDYIVYTPAEFERLKKQTTILFARYFAARRCMKDELLYQAGNWKNSQ